MLNDAGKIAHNEWIKTSELRPQIDLHAFVIMPNHMHGIIAINESPTGGGGGRGELHSPLNTDGDNELHSPPNTDNELHSPPNMKGVFNTPQPLPNSEGVYDTPQSGELNSPLRSPSQTIGAVVRGYKSSVTKWFRNNTEIYTPWQRNYYEHIIRNQQSYNTISAYIANNPAKWTGDKFFEA